MDGYYLNDQIWMPWDSSCKTCISGDKWESWEKYMFLDSTSQLWHHWSEGEYFDITSQVCRNWNDSWRELWKYQQSWMQWANNKTFDLESFECVDEWGTDTVLIEDGQLNLKSVWRSFEYYVDPLSTSMIELGTKEHPYRTIESVNLEIINFHSHTDSDIII